MENKQIKVNIKNIENKEWQGKPFIVVLTNEGEFTCWKPEMFGLITAAKNSGEQIDIEVTKSAKGKWSITGVEGIVTPTRKTSAIGAAITRKEDGINKFTERKENAIVEAAIRRDAALFSSACWQGFGGEKKTDTLKKAHEYWLEYFRKLYASKE